MLKNIENKNYLKNLVDKKAKLNDRNYLFLENKSFVDVMRDLKTNIEFILELGFLDDCREEILNGIKNKNISINEENLILNGDNLSRLSTDTRIAEILKFLDYHCLCIIVEPNKNMYISIDYQKAKSIMEKHISVEANRALSLHYRVQESAIVDSESNLLTSKVDELRHELIVSCDFEKNPILFPYCCESLSELELGLAVYSRMQKLKGV